LDSFIAFQQDRSAPHKHHHIATFTVPLPTSSINTLPSAAGFNVSNTQSLSPLISLHPLLPSSPRPSSDVPSSPPLMHPLRLVPSSRVVSTLPTPGSTCTTTSTPICGDALAHSMYCNLSTLQPFRDDVAVWIYHLVCMHDRHDVEVLSDHL
jgi:hypothetical protein